MASVLLRESHVTFCASDWDYIFGRDPPAWVNEHRVKFMDDIDLTPPKPITARSNRLSSLIKSKTATIGVVGLGYVGLPLATSIAEAGFKTIGFDIDASKVRQIENMTSYIDAVSSATLEQLMRSGKLSATTDFVNFTKCDVICLCIPTPLSRQREPDLSFIENTAREISKTLRAGQLVVLESTTYPGTTDEVLKPILESTGLVSGNDFFIAYSPEREDPGNKSFTTTTIPKVVAGDGQAAQGLVEDFYGSFIKKIVPVSSVKTAEVVKITENVFRAVNIALVNELKIIYDAMGIDIWEVIEAAKTKPFGFMPFYPGPGLGGHCIPVDPFYLTWKSREFELPTRFIELAGEINQRMPRYIIAKLEEALDKRLSLAMSQAAILVIGVAYKKNVSDIRESPALKIMELLEERVADLAFHDPHVTNLSIAYSHAALANIKSIDINNQSISAYDATIILTDHDDIDYALIARHSRLVIDTRNALAARSIACSRLIKA
jgi:UDP-N-acetyl-D-glucosamine dehydrogenase